jgi:hypothetical protein
MTKRPMDPATELKPTPPVEEPGLKEHPGPPSYEEEIEAERRGTTAEEIEEPDVDEVDDSEPDAAYRPGTG